VPPPLPHHNVRFVSGWFADTLAPFLAERPDEAVAIAHIDCDMCVTPHICVDGFALTLPLLCVSPSLPAVPASVLARFHSLRLLPRFRLVGANWGSALHARAQT
jgi:hypothetical protein